MKDQVIKILEKHLTYVSNIGTPLYIARLTLLIERLKADNYEDHSELMSDLRSLGFPDLALKIWEDRFT